MKKILCLSLVLVMLMSAILTGCSAMDKNGGSSADEGFNYSPGMGAPSGEGYDKGEAADIPEAGEMPPYADGDVAGGIAAGVAERKRIQYVTVEMETLEYERALSELKTRTSAIGGYIESSRETGKSVYGSGSRRAELVLRIPTGELDGFTGNFALLGSVLSQYTTTDDVTDSYFDREARLASLELQRDKYMELLERADSMEYIILLTEQLTQVTYEIELITGTLNKYDSLIAYSVVTVNINEVVELTKEPNPDPTFGEQIADAFSDSLEAFVLMWQGLVIALAAAFPFLVIPAVIVIVIIVVVRAKSKKRRRQMAQMMPPPVNGDRNGSV